MEDQAAWNQATWTELTEQVMENAPALEQRSGLILNGMAAFTIDDLARELDMDDAEQKRQLAIVVGKLVDEGRLIAHTKRLLI